MMTDEERIKILEMLADGIITADEAAELLEVSSATDRLFEADETAPDSATASSSKAHVETSDESGVAARGPGSEPNWLHIRIDDLKSGQRKLNVNIPLRLLKLGVEFGSNFAPGLSKVDWKALGTSLVTAGDGMLIDVIDEEEGGHVKIYVD